MRIPLVGKIIHKVALVRFTQTLGSLLHSGVSLLDALDVTAHSIGNRIIQEEILRMKQDASVGITMETALSRSKLFPDLVVQMISVGEETSELSGMLLKTADYYEQEVDAAIEALTSIIEPVIIVFLGALLGGTVIAVYLQIFDLMNVIQ